MIKLRYELITEETPDGGKILTKRDIGYRPLLLPGGGQRWIQLPFCTCKNRRGPVGGVCGCGNAIPEESK